MLLFLLACATCPEGRRYADANGDGYGDRDVHTCGGPGVRDHTDCSDGHKDIHPGAPELCNGEDDDCDGEIDEAAVDMLGWWADADGDGWGDPTSRVLACAPHWAETPDGATDNALDCDDGDDAVNPAATETCNDTDDDCDGAVDDNATDMPTWFWDADGDGYGSKEFQACDLPEEASAVGGDCADDDAAISPGATEDCTNDVDDNCDGAVNSDATDYGVWYTDADGDSYGAARVTPDCRTDPGQVATPRPSGADQPGRAGGLRGGRRAHRLHPAVRRFGRLPGERNAAPRRARSRRARPLPDRAPPAAPPPRLPVGDAPAAERRRRGRTRAR